MADYTAAESVLKKLREAATTITKQQTSIIERYSDIFQKLLQGDLAKTDVKKWTEFWVGEAKTFARTMTDVNLTYYKALVDLGDQFSSRLEKVAKGTKAAAAPAAARRPAKRRARKRAARPAR